MTPSTTNSILFGFLEKFTEAVLIKDENDNTVFANPSFCKFTMLSQEEIQNLNTSEYFNIRVNYKTEPDDSNTQWESNLSRADGSQIWVKVNVTSYTTESGTPWKIYSLVSSSTLEQLQSLLKESEKRFETLADASPVMIWMTDRDNLAYYFNKSWLDFRGRRFEDEMGTGWLSGVHKDDLNSFNTINYQIKHNLQYSCEYRLRRNDGVYRNILEIGTPRFLPDKTFAGYMGSCLDITEMKLVQQELAGYTAELKRSNEELENFAYVASHDMQEPLRMIASYIQLIQKGIESGKTVELSEFMKYVTDGVTRMQLLISDLLQFSRVNSKGSPFVKVDVNDLLRVVQTNISEKVKETNTLIKVERMPIVMADRTQLMRLFQNLLENAIKFRSPNRQPIVTVSVEESELFFTFSVADNGIGIENKFYNRIFVIFQRLHSREEYEGTGIGLAVCKKIVERHGGQINVESKVGEGSIFKFSIKK